MTTPTTSIYVRPGSTSYTWTFNNASVATASGSSAITAVSFFLDSSANQQMARGYFQYSSNGGSTWSSYALPTDSEGAWLPASTVWRFVDQDTNEVMDPGTFTMHWQLADGSVASSSAGVAADDQPVGLVNVSGSMLSTLHNGDAVTVLKAIDGGNPLGGTWVIDGQSQPGLFGLSTDAATGVTKLVIANAAAMPSLDTAATVSVHYYDIYQKDANGNPVGGVAGTMSFNVVKGSSTDLAAFGNDAAYGAASGASAAPVLATLSNGTFAAAWQGSDSAIWGQLHDLNGNAVGSPFAITSGSDAAVESQPALGMLAGGRFVAAYTLQQLDGSSQVAFRIVEANGSVGAQVVAGANASMAAVTGLADGSFMLAWTSGGQVHLQHESATGAPVGSEQVLGALGTAYNPSLTALSNGDYAVSWGEIGDGNVYTATGSNLSPGAVTTDGAAANVMTAAPLSHVTALAGGGYVVAWDSYSNDTRGFSMSDIFFQRFDNGGHALGAIQQANLDGGSGHFDAEVAATPDGGFVVAWQGPDADGMGVFGRRYAADGSAVDGHEFQINQMAQGNQTSPALTSFTNGGFATAWIDSGASGSTIEARVLVGSGSSGSTSSGSTGSGSTSGGGTSGGTTGTGSTGSGSTGTGSTSGGSTDTSGTGSTGTGSTGSGGTTTTTPDHLTGTTGNNVFVSGTGSHVIDGGGGLDTVTYSGAHTAYTVTTGTAGLTVTGGAGAVQDTLTNIERLQFSDETMAFDISGTAGQAYRLYQAAFGRTPDAAGLGYWIKAMDNGMSLDQASNGFVASQEFANLYGPNSSDSLFVQTLYMNVLHRSGDQAGYDFWMAAIQQHGESRAQVLSNFSESAENQAQVIGTIQHGIEFLPWN
ncbi:hypothetical protein GCM10027321_43260 [Massilia terrae]|uniref:DUF4214 domain-containing protein n=1 Tax=Massilia terrae TaxID=1811224 RepID=A0ABT2D4N6_9BURK|nr:DUF4214 domain-containing protein [Massilia terrae]MCS0661212.1 DUF4214 domain-containing protein [Massilia terrae]